MLAHLARLLSVIWLLVGSAWAVDLEGGLPDVRAFGPRDYLGHEQVWGVVERPDGVLLMGNRDQVLEYDGATWRRIPVPGGSFIRGLAIDAAGTVWLAGVNELGRVVSGPDGVSRYESLRGHVPAELGDLGVMTRVHVMPDGVYFLGSVALLRWDGRAFAVWPLDENRSPQAHALAGRLLVGRAAGWFFPAEGGRWERVPAEGDPIARPRGVVSAPGGGWYICIDGEGWSHYDGRRLERRPSVVDAWLKTKRAYSATLLASGRIMVCSLQGGAALLGPDLGLLALFDEGSGLETRTAITAFEDSQGAVWVGTDNGVVRLALGGGVTRIGAAQGLGRNGPDALVRWRGRLLLALIDGVGELQAAAQPMGNPRVGRLPGIEDRVAALSEIGEDLWALGVESAHRLSADGRIERLEQSGGLRELVSPKAYPDILYGTQLNGLARWRREAGRWVFAGQVDGIRGEVRGLREDADGALWTAIPGGGVWRIETGADGEVARTVLLGEASGLPAGRVNLAMRSGRVVFYRGPSACRWDPVAGRFESAGAWPGDESGVWRHHADDDRGGIWGIAETADLVPSQLQHLRDGRVEVLAVPELARIGAVSALAWERIDGRDVVWIAGQTALLRVDVEASRRAMAGVAERVLLREVSVGGVRRSLVSGPERMRVKAGEGGVRFAVAAPALAGDSLAVYETVLRGRPDEARWVGASAERVFDNLGAGHYTFVARGRSGDGRWTAPVEFGFVVVGPWWSTVWAVVGYIGLSGAAVVWVFRWRWRWLLRERQRLEALVAERTAELERRNADLERLHLLERNEVLAARFAEEKAQLEMLRYQLNPHFLFNALNSIRALVFSSPQAAGDMVTQLAEFCRGTLTKPGVERVTVAEEAEMARAYLAIEQTRWQSMLEARIEVAPEVAEDRLPRFALLPLVENAVKYGGKTSSGRLVVTVRFWAEGDVLCGDIVNTGRWWAAAEGERADSTHIGLDNLRTRLARHYGTAATLQAREEPGQVRMCLRLPRRTPG